MGDISSDYTAIKMKGVCTYFLVTLIVMCKGEGQCKQEISAKCPSPDPGTPVYLADPEDCSKFCECSGGAAWSEHCADGLMYDEILHLCNWPNSVDCGSRPIIEGNSTYIFEYEY